MIFKQLFRSKHQNPDPQVRIQAIEKLNKQDPQQKSVLHELAFNDADAGVSLAALQKLDSFALWHKMSEISKNDRVQKRSQQFVETSLLDEQSQVLTEQDKRKFLFETRDIRLIEKLLGQIWIQKDTELAMQLLQKVDKPQLQEKLLFDTQNESLQTAILNTLTDDVQARKLLNKVQRKSASSTLNALASQILQGWIKAEKEPIEVEQQVKMVLSRLLALKDQSDFLHVQQQQTELNHQYAQIANRLACLSELKRTEIEQKHIDISLRVERTIASLKPQWQAQQAEQALKQNIDTLLVESDQNLTDLSTQLSARISEIDASEISAFIQKIELHIEQLTNLASQLSSTNQTAHRRLEQLNNQLLSSLNTLNSIPEFQQAIQLGRELLDKFTSLALPDDISQIEAADEYLREQKQEWRNTVARFQAHIPDTLSKQWNECLTSWQQAVKALKNQLYGEVSRCRNKLKTVESLISQGKFKAAMGLYQKVQNWFNALPENQQGQLERTFTSIKEKIENLKDWQDYIAAPRKPMLLDEVEALIAHPLEIDAQSAAIKSLRYQWNSLGKIDAESDQILNAAFEVAIEKAFAPCREFYDQQQQQREQNLLAKQQLLAEVKALGEEHGNITELAKNLRRVQQKWKGIGEVDFKLRNALFEDYQQLLNPLRDKVSVFYKDNAEQKQILVTKAEKLLELESVDEAIEQAKQLQQKWKTIEHAGRKAEDKLWPAFRKANDSVFAKKLAANQQEKTQLNEQIGAAKEQIAQLETALDNATDSVGVQNALKDKQSVIDAVTALPMRERRALEQCIQTVAQQQQLKLTELTKFAKAQAYQDLFKALKIWQSDSEIPDCVVNLSKQWQQCFRELSEQNHRHDLTIQMEIVAQKESPKEDAAKRKSIQMQLMAQKLESGDSVDLSTLLKNWIRAGSLSQHDIMLLKRIEPLFVNS